MDPFDPAIDELVARRATAREILTAARASGFRTLADDGVRLVRAGVTGLDEVMRVVTKCWKAMSKDCARITFSVKGDWRRGAKGRLDLKIAAVEKKLGRKLRT